MLGRRLFKAPGPQKWELAVRYFRLDVEAAAGKQHLDPQSTAMRS